MKKHPDSAWLDFCYLAPEVRGTEASGLVADRIDRMAADNDCEAIYLTVHQKNSRAIRFYEKNGWKLDKIKDNGHQRMKKTLT
jgi:RimJ/RimL family protein N-acetyltransferase